MFVTVICGEGKEEIFNLNCKTIHFIHCVKEKCNLNSEETVDLMDGTGELVNLAERAQSTETISSLLKERQTYIPLHVSQGTEGPKYSAVFGDIGTSYPELAEVLQKLSNPSKERDKKGRAWKKGGIGQNRLKAAVNFKKSHTSPQS